MKKILISFVISTLLIVGCSVQPLPDDLRSCDSTDDCISVGGRGCCSCDTPINKRYEDLWYNRKVSECPADRMCEPCPPPAIDIECINNRCAFLYE